MKLIMNSAVEVVGGFGGENDPRNEDQDKIEALFSTW